MGKFLLVILLFLIVVNTTWETKAKKEVKREYTSKILSNVMFIFLGQRVISVASDIFNIIMLCILLYSTCPNIDTLSTALYKEKFWKEFTFEICNTILSL